MSELSHLKRRWKLLHRWYAWIVTGLFLSGVLLYWPGLRAALAPVRVLIINIHVALGIAGAAVTVAYLFTIVAHWRTLSHWLGRKINTVFVVALSLGWSMSGFVLWWDRLLLPWTSAALWWHDVLTIIGIPYLIGHAIVRLRKIDLALPWAYANRKAGTWGSGLPDGPRLEKAIARRRFMTDVLTRGTVLLLGLSGIRWLLKMNRIVEADWGDVPIAADYTLPVPDPRSSPPVGGGARGRFRIYNVANQMPVFDPLRWRLEVDGLVRHPISMRWDDVVKLPRDVWVRDFHCVSGWSVYNVTWEGIRVSHLLEMAGIRPEATHVKFYSYDGVYTDALTIEQAMLDDTILAMLKDGKPLNQSEGGPVRLIMPRMFAYKSVKWLTRMELIDEPHTGFWQRLGYAEDAWIPGVPKSGPWSKDNL